MTGDSKLTFIRCPECRSLVPAISTKCRMCGASLEKVGEQQEAEQPKQPRVRQKTILKTNDEISELTNKIKREIGTPEEEEPKKQKEEAPKQEEQPKKKEAPVEKEVEEKIEEVETVENNDLDDEDPLADYISLHDEITEEDTLDDIEEAENIIDDGFYVKEEEEPLELLDEEEDPFAEDIILDNKVEEEKDPFAETDSIDEELEIAQKPVKTENKEVKMDKKDQKVIVEQGGRNKQNKLSFGKKDFNKNGPKDDNRKPNTSFDNKQNFKKEAPVQPKVEVKEAAKPQVESSTNVQQSDKLSIQQGVKMGKLLGWLVSYSDPNGKAIELREGKFFITSHKLKDTDLVIDDESISSPHAVFKINSDGLMIQDLMSDTGVFVKHTAKDKNYKKEEGTVKVEHGTWIKLGDLEFLTVLIPQ